MSNLIVLGFDGKPTADEVLNKLRSCDRQKCEGGQAAGRNQTLQSARTENVAFERNGRKAQAPGGAVSYNQRTV